MCRVELPMCDRTSLCAYLLAPIKPMRVRPRGSAQEMFSSRRSRTPCSNWREAALLMPRGFFVGPTRFWHPKPLGNQGFEKWVRGNYPSLRRRDSRPRFQCLRQQKPNQKSGVFLIASQKPKPSE